MLDLLRISSQVRWLLTMHHVKRFDAGFAEETRQCRIDLGEIRRPFPNDESADGRHRVSPSGSTVSGCKLLNASAGQRPAACFRASSQSHNVYVFDMITIT